MLRKFLIFLVPAMMVAALAVALASGPAAADTFFKCPPGVTNHKYCKKTVKCVVPQLRGDSVGQARRALNRHDCKVGKIERVKVKHSSVKKGHVLRSSPPSHTTHKKGTKVRLFVRK